MHASRHNFINKIRAAWGPTIMNSVAGEREEDLVVSPGPTHPHLVGPSGTHDSPYLNMDQ